MSMSDSLECFLCVTYILRQVERDLVDASPSVYLDKRADHYGSGVHHGVVGLI